MITRLTITYGEEVELGAELIGSDCICGHSPNAHNYTVQLDLGVENHVIVQEIRISYCYRLGCHCMKYEPRDDTSAATNG